MYKKHSKKFGLTEEQLKHLDKGIIQIGETIDFTHSLTAQDFPSESLKFHIEKEFNKEDEDSGD